MFLALLAIIAMMKLISRSPSSFGRSDFGDQNLATLMNSERGDEIARHKEQDETAVNQAIRRRLKAGSG